MMKFHALVKEHAQELAELIVKENGKNITEALADGTFSFENDDVWLFLLYWKRGVLTRRFWS